MHRGPQAGNATLKEEAGEWRRGGAPGGPAQAAAHTGVSSALPGPGLLNFGETLFS